jgi:ribosomal protein S18 acetylase RimI-like enzyme
MLTELEAYYDAVPRTACRVEQIGPFSLFINRGPGWPYYARPSLDSTRFAAADVQRVRQRQRELDVPEAFEWVAETTPALAAAAEAAGLTVTQHPLMVLDEKRRPAPPAPEGVTVRLVASGDDLAVLNAINRVAFGAPGSAPGKAGLEDALKVVKRDPAALAAQQARLQSGRTVTTVALVEGQPVGIGSHQPLGPVSEIVGVGVLPAFRRHGIAAALTSCLVSDALQRGVRTVFLSAGDDTISQIYERVGFRQIGSALIAEPLPSSNQE